ncbi:MAG: hypothetical protein GY789_17310 [Hyphomicrobiales bacterium]|nr:hypothetical protein [Hyphomicrobiales bacterium]
MITFQRESPISVSGRELIVVARIRLIGHAQGHALMFTGEKRPVAVICRGEGGEEIFDMDGRRIEAAALQALMVD